MFNRFTVTLEIPSISLGSIHSERRLPSEGSSRETRLNVQTI